ncbi:MAG: hypothetical protein Ta2D_08860 [Rickettsiales bacterium]|nr:MAG: hypothetical protein Ta2D_08860 [Rickettsiales bacterium]
MIKTFFNKNLIVLITLLISVLSILGSIWKLHPFGGNILEMAIENVSLAFVSISSLYLLFSSISEYKTIKLKIFYICFLSLIFFIIFIGYYYLVYILCTGGCK